MAACEKARGGNSRLSEGNGAAKDDADRHGNANSYSVPTVPRPSATPVKTTCCRPLSEQCWGDSPTRGLTKPSAAAAKAPGSSAASARRGPPGVSVLASPGQQRSPGRPRPQLCHPRPWPGSPGLFADCLLPPLVTPRPPPGQSDPHPQPGVSHLHGACLSRLCLPSLPASSSPRKKERITKPRPCRVFSRLPDSLSRRLPLLRISSPYLTLQTPAHPSRPHLSVASVRAFPGLAPGQALLGSPPSLHLPQRTSVV